MPTVVWGDLPVSEFALQETFETVPDAVFECEQVVENGQEVTMPLVWARAGDPDELDVALESDPSVEEVTKVAELDGEALYRIEWTQRTQLVLQMMLNTHGSILDAYGNSERWRLRIFYPDREKLSETNDFCEEHGLTFDVKRVRDMDSEPAGRYGLTDEQYESLKRAWEAGYFDVPRETGIEELAEELDISHQALSERLRRGHNTLVENMLGVSVPE
jgi:predicted DNA binding protein